MIINYSSSPAMPPARTSSEAAAQLISGITAGPVVYAALRTFLLLGLGDHMERPTHVLDLAYAVEADADALYRVLRLLAAHGVVIEHGHEVFTLTEAGHLLDTDRDDSMGPLALMRGEQPWWDCLTGLPDIVRTGISPHCIYDYLAVERGKRELFDHVMGTSVAPVAAAVAARPELEQFRTLVDLGGGTGQVLKQILLAHPHLTGILMELPPTDQAARHTFEAAGLSEQRCRTVAGDILRDTIPAGDVLLMSRVVHTFDEADAIGLLTAVRKQMQAGAQLWIVELAVRAQAVPNPALVNDIVMLMVSGGRERSIPDYQELAAAAGLYFQRYFPLEGTGGYHLMVFTCD